MASFFYLLESFETIEKRLLNSLIYDFGENYEEEEEVEVKVRDDWKWIRESFL